MIPDSRDSTTRAWEKPRPSSGEPVPHDHARGRRAQTVDTIDDCQDIRLDFTLLTGHVVPTSAMQPETKFLRLGKTVELGSRFGEWQVTWFGGGAGKDPTTPHTSAPHNGR
jgi:hypothetical protein